MFDIIEEYNEALHGPQSPRFHQGDSDNKHEICSPSSRRNRRNVKHEESAEDSDEELFSMMDRMAALEAAAEAGGRDDSGTIDFVPVYALLSSYHDTLRVGGGSNNFAIYPAIFP